MVKRILHGTEAPDELDRSFVANSGSAGNIVDRISAQGHYIDHLLRGDAENFFDLGGITYQVVLGRIQNADLRANELQHVFIAGDHVHGITGSDSLMRKRSDYI